ncbi:MAG: CvpA family protein [Desulfobacterota bacterium]|nr:CvpA family protein [Thermodesulfobacteriota bacterium]
MGPNFLDLLIIIFILAGYFLSSLRGGSKQIFSLLVILVAFFISGRYYWNIGGVLPEKVFPESFAGTVGFVIIFLLVFIFLTFIGRFFDTIFNLIHFGSVDRIVSIAFGIIKGLVLSNIALIILMINYPPEAPLLKNSMVSPYLLPSAKKLIVLLPPAEQKEFFRMEKELKKLWKKYTRENK